MSENLIYNLNKNKLFRLNWPASEPEGVSFTPELELAGLVDPHEVDEAGPVVELDLVEDRASVASLRDERQVVHQVGEAGIRSEKRMMTRHFLNCFFKQERSNGLGVKGETWNREVVGSNPGCQMNSKRSIK